MNFLIDGRVVYDSLNGTLRLINESSSEAVMLTKTANKILLFLVNHQGELVSRNSLFDEIWDKAGVVSSSNTLNQYVSTLRKLFSNYLGDTEVIITIPRAGYILSKDVTIARAEKSIEKKQHKKYLKWIIASIAAFGFCSLLYQLCASDKLSPRRIGEIEGCPVYDLSGVKSDHADASHLAAARQSIDINNLKCTNDTSYYIFAEETLHINKPARLLLSRCVEWKDNRDTCQNIYYYNWRRT